MPIREVLSDRIEQDCITCGDVHEVSLTTLSAGGDQGTQVGGTLVQLPPCPACGAAEFLVASAEAEPEHPTPGSFGHRHKLLVDTLFVRLVRAGRCANGLDPATLPTKEPSSETMAKWFPRGLRLNRPKARDEQGEEQ